jgi:putative oxidoreductase
MSASTSVPGYGDTDDVIGTARGDETVPAQSFFRRLVATPRSYGLTIGRLVLGGVMFVHASQKVFGWFGGPGLEGAHQGFTQMMGIPSGLAWLAIFVELVSAIALFFGVLTRLAAIGIIAIMVGAIAYVHAPNGFFMNWTGSKAGEGFEFHLVVIGFSLVFLGLGAGALAIDRALMKRRPAEGGSIGQQFVPG